jgi:hypothetical protein
MCDWHSYNVTGATRFKADARKTVIDLGDKQVSAYDLLKKLSGSTRAKIARKSPELREVLIEMGRQHGG